MRYPCLITKAKDIYPSCTTIISDCTDKGGALTQWAANMCKLWIEENCGWNPLPGSQDKPAEYGWYDIYTDQLDEMRFHFREVSQKALDIGSEVHDAIEMHLQNKLFKLTTDEAKNAFDAFLDWEKENNLKPINIEQKVYGSNWAGKLDFYGYYNGKLYVIDWKSSKAHYPEMRYQVAAYRSAVAQRIADDWQGYDVVGNWEIYEQGLPKGCGVLRLDKETGLPDFKDHSKSYESDLAVFNAMVDLYYLRHPRIRANFQKNKEARDEIS